MSISTSIKHRESKKEVKPPYNPIKAKFQEKYKDFSDIDILKEQLFSQKIQIRLAKRTADSVNVIKWILIISLVACVIAGIMIGFEVV